MITLLTLRSFSMAQQTLPPKDPLDLTDPIANALEVTPVDDKTVTLPDRENKRPKESQTELDLEYARENYMDLIEKGRHSLEDLMDIARQSQHPRAYEVIATLIKTVTDTNEKVVNLQKQAKEILSDSEQAKKVTNNNLFVGSTSELTRILGGNARDILKNE